MLRSFIHRVEQSHVSAVAEARDRIAGWSHYVLSFFRCSG
jgi:hypothetical protein